MKSKRPSRYHRRVRPKAPPAPVLEPGQTEYEFGIPIAGVVVPKENWTQCALKRIPETKPVEWSEVFGRQAPLVVDIGCGNGRFTLASAIARPECNHLAIDSLPAVIRYGTRRANQRGLNHVRFAVVDGWRFLTELCSGESIAEIHIYHPQPYADPVASSRRMLTPEFIGWMHRNLIPQGKIFLQTDRKAYWDYLGGNLPKLFDWNGIEGDWPEEPEFRSRREILSRKQGLPIYRGIGVRREGIGAEEFQSIIQAMEQPTFAIEPEDA
ncbi:MAG: tRNA (guanine(46)-N(7))-methyltransferase TrmB [Planctomycetota bacterium]|jgi:tRNA (guanine-N7-)-methyltransferase